MKIVDTFFDTLAQSAIAIRWQNYYQTLPSRDQWAVKILVIFLTAVVLVFGLLVPATAYMNESVDRYQGALEDNQWIAANRGAVREGASHSPTTGQSLFGLANTSAKSFQISFKRYEPVGDNALSLWMENVSFNKLVLWLERLENRHGVSVKEISVERQQTQGLVNVRLVLQG